LNNARAAAGATALFAVDGSCTIVVPARAMHRERSRRAAFADLINNTLARRTRDRAR
jgi:hypothetical protein